MKLLLFLLPLVVPSLAIAQFTVAPFGSSSSSAPPVGDSRVSKCGVEGCLEFNVKTFCFGTNLRAYSGSSQLSANEPVTMHINLTHPENPSQKDYFKVVFPSKMTYPSERIRTDCVITNPSAPGSLRDIECEIPGFAAPVKYRITNWKVQRNPSCYANGGSRGAEYCAYAAVQTDAVLGSPVKIDSNIKCLYKFGGGYKIDNTKVGCVFPSLTPDLSSEVKVYTADGKDITDKTELKAYTNSLRFNFNSNLKSRDGKVVVKHGKVVVNKAPLHNITYTQGGRSLRAIVESSRFDESNANNSFTTIVKYPGREGFCGGYYSPLMLFFDEKLPEFNGVSTFPLYGVDEGSRVNWPEQNAPGYFLVKADKADGVTNHGQLFGKNDRHENGFEALKEYDENNDSVIDSKDKIYSSLSLWRDENGNGVSEKNELFSLKDKGVVSINLNYSSRDVTKFGSRARVREKSKFAFMNKQGKKVQSNIYDVWLSQID